ncbi:MAG: trypsin-like peptidase domain-containing protein [Acetobacteraceae bacterium]|nr:trypsin-like peptidase domain-containing protein [Acetobacteraceae bacterium]
MSSGKARGRLLLALLLVALLAVPEGRAEAGPAVRLVVNGSLVASDVPPQIFEGRTFVPLRVVSEALGAKVVWHEAMRAVEVRRGATTVSLVVGSAVAFVNGAPHPLDAPARLVEGRTLVPLRFLGESLGAEVAWDAAVQEVRVNLAPPSEPPGRSEMVAGLLRANVVVLTDAGSQGSGFVVDSSGVVATAYHVIEDARSARVLLADGRSLEVVGLLAASQAADLALLQVEAEGLPTMPLGDSDSVRVADRVLALGNPLGLVGTVSEGIVSALRPQTPLTSVSAFQVTAPVSPGSSGGALVNEAGQVVGVVFATTEGGQLLNFATPVNYLRPLLSETRLASLPGGAAAAAPGGTGGGGATVEEYIDCANAWIDSYNGLEAELASLREERAGDRRLAEFNGRAVRELEPLTDAVISAALPGEYARLHQVTVKFQVAMLLTYEMARRAYEAADEGREDQLVAGSDELIEVAEPWRLAANELGGELSPPPSAGERGGATAEEYLQRLVAWAERYEALQDEIVDLQESGARDDELAAVNRRAVRDLEPLADAVISAAPAGEYRRLHQLSVKFLVAVLLVHELHRRGYEASDPDYGEALLIAGDELIEAAETWREEMNRLWRT